ncbi:hypothetical protein LZ012_02500 [Dechloromonas sp. XY25]|uniref:AAA+ ATPase domain-containing protein n=1 Tax=Dechloromonas hankyongensis TaxID=2908002 RepID=A0ABS9JY71_9RHOO|nr:hypothetical protein [Dechloromonas hankyongensis]MCG2575862.1 hypothetical protein [Dechloromonas hankyongensis]
MMNPLPHFTAGESLSAIDGDPSRQAVASLRGYAYQLYASSIAWVALQSGEELLLEVAEDYATLVGNVLNGVQVKDTARSSSLTINNEDVQVALDGFVDLVERNPTREVHLRYLTTSEIGVEREKADRAAGEGVLTYWRKAAAMADVLPLRSALMASSISARVKRFISSRTDEQLRNDLLRRIHWDTGSQPLEDLERELAASLVEFASDRLRVSPRDCDALPGVVVTHILQAIVKTGSGRHLRQTDLLRLCETATKMTLAKSSIESLLAQLSTSSGGGHISIGGRSILEVETSYPTLKNVLSRPNVTDPINAVLKSTGAVFVVGGSGLGKTTNARNVARMLGGTWLVLPLADRSAQETEHILATALAQGLQREFSGLIVDDINEIEDSTVCRRFSQLLTAIRRRDAVCIATAYREPTTRSLDTCGLSMEHVVRVPNLDQDEVAQLVSIAGGDVGRSARLVFLLSSMGHPQLAKAVIASARRSGWSSLEGETISIKEVQADVDSERRRLRTTLVARLDENRRRLLLRTSLLHGRFPRELGCAVGNVEPGLPLPGELLNSLIGPWIDEVGGGRLRVSPLVGGAGAEDLSANEQRATHAEVARWLSPTGKTLDAADVNTLFFHSTMGEVEEPLTKIALAVFGGDAELNAIAAVLPLLLYAETDRLIFAKNPHLSKMLRLAQLLLASEAKMPDFALSVWSALTREIDTGEQTRVDRGFEMLALSKALISQTLASVLPRPARLLQRLLDVSQSDPMFPSLIQHLDGVQGDVDGWAAPAISFLFTNVAMSIGSVERQRQLFDDLDGLDPLYRETFLPVANLEQGWIQTTVNAAWLAETKAGTLKAEDAAANFEVLEACCIRWHRIDIAVHFRVARAVMLDEYANSPEQAEHVLADAEHTFGANSVIARAKVRLRFRHKRYQDVLFELERGPEAVLNADPLERTFLFREVGISAAGTGDWPSAAGWFARAYESLLTGPASSLTHMRIGLRADAALAAFKGGDRQSCIAEYAEALMELSTLDSDDSLNAAYCKRVVRHGLLWLYGEAMGYPKGIEIDNQPPYMVAGMCSNLQPSEAIREQQLAHIDTAWYLLAVVEARYLGNAVAATNLQARLCGREVPALSLTCTSSFLECAVRRRSSLEFVQALRPWMNNLAYVTANFDSLKQWNLSAPEYATVRDAPESALEQDQIQSRLSQAVLALGVLCAIAKDTDPLLELANSLRTEPGCKSAADLFGRMLSVPDGKDESTQDYVASAIRLAIERPELSPNEIYTTTLRFLQACDGNSFKGAFESAFVSWAKHQWFRLANQRFALKSPAVVVPAIEVALRYEGLRAVAMLLRTTTIGFDVRLNESWFPWLKTFEDKSKA